MGKIEVLLAFSYSIISLTPFCVPVCPHQFICLIYQILWKIPKCCQNIIHIISSLSDIKYKNTTSSKIKIKNWNKNSISHTRVSHESHTSLTWHDNFCFVYFFCTSSVTGCNVHEFHLIMQKILIHELRIKFRWFNGIFCCGLMWKIKWLVNFVFEIVIKK